MKVHIVALPHGHKSACQILPRLAQLLADGTGWALGKDPDPNVDLNYYLPYLLRDGVNCHTMSAGWFTHREESWPQKAAVWDKVARAFDLRTVSTQKYARVLEPLGDTAIVTPPLDLEKFRPVKHPPNRKPVVGVAGYVYKQSNRKGEDLLVRLTQDPIAQKVEIRASGQGWPGVRNETRSWGDMEKFYQGLDVLLCTSTIEGPGYTPMEALACGVKVVVPIDVGVFDELPDVRGICRYPRGEFADMCRALRTALEIRADPDKLRATVERFTPQAWLADHQQAFRDLLYPAPPLPPDRFSDWRGRAGVYMVAYGDPARNCAERAIASWHHHMPGVPVCLVSDRPLGPEDVFVEHHDADLGARSIKTSIYDMAPADWKYVIYVDADTEVVANVGFLFDLLVDGWEMFICYNPEDYVLARNMIREDNEVECDETFKMIGTDEFLQANGGVFGFRRNDRTARFFRNWHEEWLRYGKRDQAAFDRALYAAPLRVYMLGAEWNTITRYYLAKRTAGILHYPTLARRWQGIIHSRLDEPKAWKEAGLR